jgi:hypothetical protein
VSGREDGGALEHLGEAGEGDLVVGREEGEEGLDEKLILLEVLLDSTAGTSSSAGTLPRRQTCCAV